MRRMRNIHVPAYWPADWGVQVVEKSDVVWEFAKVIGIDMDDPDEDDDMSMLDAIGTTRICGFDARRCYSLRLLSGDTRRNGRLVRFVRCERNATMQCNECMMTIVSCV